MRNRGEDASLYISFSPDGKNEIKASWTIASSYLCEKGGQHVGQPPDILDSILFTDSNDSEARKGNNRRRGEGRVARPASHMGEGTQTLGQM